ncbi:hypothetical protein KIH39_22250 [Telmatocola sphagniphila]|uniref:Uncharacterized protein n=1 Tax=Telmatocola sphagniphila TaxID=1123043 RepID=A0A8E6EXE4_9BACT|nr:hypothetical protein [Telmatocola sphagniphila]QVL31538.1 hypothetical protein KIH39_22250 [Telmatocola sphagniphila]
MRRLSLIFLALWVCTGCNKTAGTADKKGNVPNTKESSDDRQISNDLKQLGLAFLNYTSTQKDMNPITSPFVGSLDVLKPYLGEKENPRLVPTLESGKYKIFWNAPAKQRILACEKDAETKGGLVLTRIGSVERMSAEEIQKAIVK